MTKEELAALKPGDRVWLGDSRQPHREGTRPVTKVTRTLITVGGRRFKRINGFAWGYGSCWITALATPAECAAWDAEQVTKAEAARQQRRADEERKRKQDELRSLFETITSARITDPGWIELTITGLSEAQVRRVAEALKEGSDGR